MELDFVHGDSCRLVQIVFLPDRLSAQLMLRRHRVMTAGIALQNCSAAAIVQTVTNYTDAKLIAKLSEDLGEALVGINEQEIALLMAER